MAPVSSQRPTRTTIACFQIPPTLAIIPQSEPMRVPYDSQPRGFSATRSSRTIRIVKILLVEDDTRMVQIVRKALHESGYTVRHAGSGPRDSS